MSLSLVLFLLNLVLGGCTGQLEQLRLTAEAAIAADSELHITGTNTVTGDGEESNELGVNFDLTLLDIPISLSFGFRAIHISKIMAPMVNELKLDVTSAASASGSGSISNAP